MAVNQGNLKTSGGLVVEGAQVKPMVQVGPTIQVDVAAQGGELAGSSYPLRPCNPSRP